MILIKHIRQLFLFSYFFISAFVVTAQVWPAGIHDPSSIVKCDDTYWIFGTGDGIYSMYSKDLISWTPVADDDRPFRVKKYESGGEVIVTSSTYPTWINNYVTGAKDPSGNRVFHGGFWAPDIIFMNNQYYLYYSCSEWGTMTSTIGCVTNKTLNPSDPDYKWVDAGFLGIWSYQPGLALNAIDPSVTRGADGNIWMVYGSFNEEGIVVTEIDSISGKPKTYAGNLPGVSIANSWTGPQSYNYGEGEGASMIYRDGYYYLFYNKGGCCAGIGSTYYMVMGRSTDPRGPFLDKTGKALKINGQPSGGTVVLRHDNSRGTEDRYFGPGHFGMYSEKGVDYVTFHYYDPNGFYPNPAVNNQGGPTLGLAKLVWQEDGWPSISLDFLDAGIYRLENLLSEKVVDVDSHSLTEGAFLYQYENDTVYDTQKWIFSSLGTGEYVIQNYADPKMVVEATGTNNASILNVTSDYTGAINQKFRSLTPPNGKTILYPSTKDVIWGPFAATSNNARISLQTNQNLDFQRWNAILFDETLDVSETKLTIDHHSGINASILVESNGLWSASVLHDSWLNVEASGVGNDTLSVFFLENTGSNDRKNRIYVTSNGGQTILITVTQLGKPTAVEDIEANEQINIYPNPTSGDLFIESTEKSVLTIYNQSGQILKHLEIEPGENHLDICNFNSGIYLFRFLTDNKAVITRLVKN